MNGTRNVRTAGYKEQLGRLPEEIQKLAEAVFDLFVEDPSHPSLRHHSLGKTKKGRHRADSFSVSITVQYRAIYTRDVDTNVWYWIGSHADYDSFTGKK